MSDTIWKRPGLREPVNALTHLITAAAAAVGLIVLLVLGRGDPVRVASLIVYGLSLVVLFAASGLYHAVNAGPLATARLRKFDHSAIYLLIAGTYTPICLHFFTGFWQCGMVALIWALALTGVVVKLFVIAAPRWLTAGVYLIMGWLGILAAGEIWRQMPSAAIAWLILGGALFTVGAVIYVLKRPDPWPRVFGFHEIWHIFIILAALAHFILIARYVAGG